MSDKDGTEKATADDAAGTADSPMDVSSTGELPRFGERHPTGGFVLDPHDDSDTGIGPALPRYRDEPAGSASSSPAASGTPAGETGQSGAADTSDLAAAIAAANAATAAISTSGTDETVRNPAASNLTSDERDEFGRRNNRRKGRERAAQARAEAEGIPIEPERDEYAPTEARRFGKPVGDTEAELAQARKDAKRGTTDLGLLLLRVTVGVILAAHGAQKLFEIWGGPGIDGFAQYLQNSSDPSVGFDRFTKIMAIATGVIELGGGAMLIVGLLTPIAAAGAVGVMLSAGMFKLTTAGAGFVFFNQSGGIEFDLMVMMAAVAILLAGPGRISLDFNRGWTRRPHFGSVLWLVVGVAGAVAIWVLLNGSNPIAHR